MLAAGELISAAVFAEELTASGVDAVALTGAQAGIVTDARHGDAAILRVEPREVEALLERGAVPVVAGFAGATESGIPTTLGRGGTDLSAIAIGQALEARARRHLHRRQRRDDGRSAPHSDARARSIARRSTRCRSSRSTARKSCTTKPPSTRAAPACATRIKGLESDRGTIVDESVDHHRPVTGVTASGRLTWVRVIRGDIESPARRMETELEMFRRVAAAGISIDQVTINQAGVAFVVEGDRGTEIRGLLGDLNLAVRVREDCSKLSVVGIGHARCAGRGASSRRRALARQRRDHPRDRQQRHDFDSGTGRRRGARGSGRSRAVPSRRRRPRAS